MCKSNLIVLFCLLIAVKISSPARPDEKPYAKYKSAKFTTSNKTISDVKCFIKPYNRKNTTFNLYMKILRPIYEVFLRYELIYKGYGNSNRLLIKSSGEACSFLNGTNSNVVANWFLNLFNKDSLKLMHPCPYEGIFELKDGYIETKDLVGALLSRFPGGIYLTILKFSDKLDDNILTLITTHEYVTVDRENF